MEPYIDAHSQIWTPDVAHYPLARVTVSGSSCRASVAKVTGNFPVVVQNAKLL
jgi:hypothetical protein